MRERGFNFVELLCALAIAGVLAVIAWPSYQAQVLRSQRAVGRAALVEIAAHQASWHAQHHAYAPSLSAWYPVDAQGGVAFLRDGGTSAENHPQALYRAHLEATAEGQAYRAMVTPINAQAPDNRCGRLGYDQWGQRTASGPGGSACWR